MTPNSHISDFCLPVFFLKSQKELNRFSKSHRGVELPPTNIAVGKSSGDKPLYQHIEMAENAFVTLEDQD